jgi:hypothetical protein
MIFTKKDKPYIYSAIRYCWASLNRKKSYHAYCSQVAVERTEEWGDIMISTDGHALFISTLPSGELEPGLYTVASVPGQKGFSLDEDTAGEPFPAWRRIIPFETLGDLKNSSPQKNVELQAEWFTFPSELREIQYALARIGILLNERYLLPLMEKESDHGVFEWTFWAKTNSLCAFKGESLKDESVERFALIMGIRKDGILSFNGCKEEQTP